MPSLLIVKTGDTFPELAATIGDFDDWIVDGIGPLDVACQTVAVHRDASLPSLNEIAAIVLSGSPAMVTEQVPWMARTAGFLRAAVAAGIPTLGICFGHQLLAAALGGDVNWNPHGREIGTVTITLTADGREDPLLGLLPAEFAAQLTHRQSVLRLPPGARHLASSTAEPHQAFAIGSAWGVQFHPEFSPLAMHGYLDWFAHDLHAEGRDAGQLHEEVRPTPEATAILKHFARLAGLGS